MAKRRPAPTEAEIDAAIARAKKGKPRQLALMIKAATVKDMTWALEFEAKYRTYEFDPWNLLRGALRGAAMAKQCRDELNDRLRKAGNKAVREHRAKLKAAAKQAEVAHG
jgi:hypothetical protein